MAILKLTPSCKDYLWGGSRLRTDFGIKSDLEPLAEAWVLSCHPDGPSYLPDGTTLADYAATHPEALGTDCAKFEQFPVLTKFIDASKNLSIQVHPSNDYALKNEHQYGKTEMWYVLDCVPGAYLYYGFTHEISKEEFAERIKNNTLTEVLNAVPVHRGDCFFIPSGTLHTICQGIVVAEVQQNSNVTYRVYDYGRVGADGKPRALHIEKALDVTRRTPPQKHDFGSHLAQCEYFTVDAKKGAFDGAAGEKSFVSLLITDGALERIVVQMGDSMAAVTQPDATHLSAGAGIPLARLAQAALGCGLAGLEFAHGIPGSLGGAVSMNAGAYGGEMKDVVVSTRYLDGELRLCEAHGSAHDFGYRHSAFSDTDCVLLGSTLALTPGDPADIQARMRDLSERRRSRQPLDLPSAGSTFKRPVGGYAAALIDQAGLKGYTVGGAQVSEKHAGFVVNRGGATFDDVLRLMDDVRSAVLRTSGVELEPEVKIIRG